MTNEKFSKRFKDHEKILKIGACGDPKFSEVILAEVLFLAKRRFYLPAKRIDFLIDQMPIELCQWKNFRYQKRKLWQQSRDKNEFLIM